MRPIEIGLIYLQKSNEDKSPLFPNVPPGLELTGLLQYIFGLHDFKLGDVFGQNQQLCIKNKVFIAFLFE